MHHEIVKKGTHIVLDFILLNDLGALKLFYFLH